MSDYIEIKSDMCKFESITWCSFFSYGFCRNKDNCVHKLKKGEKYPIQDMLAMQQRHMAMILERQELILKKLNEITK